MAFKFFELDCIQNIQKETLKQFTKISGANRKDIRNYFGIYMIEHLGVIKYVGTTETRRLPERIEQYYTKSDNASFAYISPQGEKNSNYPNRLALKEEDVFIYVFYCCSKSTKEERGEIEELFIKLFNPLMNNNKKWKHLS